LRLSTVIVSVGLHAALAMGLISVAQKREIRRKAISVAVAEEKKKAKPKPPPPKPIVHPAVAKASVAPKAVASAPVHVAAAPLVTNLAMSNDDLDVGPGIGLHGSIAPKAAAAAASTKVASAISERRTQRTKEEAGGGSPEGTCEEEPTKPEAIVQTPAIDYTLYPQAQADGVEGKFKAKLVIDADGEVSNVIIVTGVEPAFDAAIVAALKRWRFKPAMACGKPVAGGVVPFKAQFELGD
jgi:periplasmic protein TonB